MALILFGMVKIRKGYGAEEGAWVFFCVCVFFFSFVLSPLYQRQTLPSSLVSLGCHLQPFETVSDYPCGN